MRLTNDMRDWMLRKAMKDIPNVDYLEQLKPIIQNVIYSHMPASAQMLYDNMATRSYIKLEEVNLRDGNRRFYMGRFFGVINHRGYDCRVDDSGFHAHKKGTTERAISAAVRRSGLLIKHIEQANLMESVQRRLKSTLASVTTSNRLRDILEPELHYIIPVDGDRAANLPATAAPVADDLRRLGATFDAAARSEAKP